MKRITLATIIALSVSAAPAHEPLALHPDNPHYFLFRQKPAVLVGSTEHYGAVLNLDFDFMTYLDEIHSCELNLTRAFSGAYCEAPGNFNIKGNTLAPAAGRLICPWARSDQPGYAGGGAKFDLDRWDPAYFERLTPSCARPASAISWSSSCCFALFMKTRCGLSARSTTRTTSTALERSSARRSIGWKTRRLAACKMRSCAR